MYCCNCGKKLGDEDQFCDNCGTPVYGETDMAAENQEREEKLQAESLEPDEGGTAVLESKADFEEAGPVSLEPSSGEGPALSDLERKIMKNMEDELILTMPEAAAQSRESMGGSPLPHAQPPYGNSQPEPPFYGKETGGKTPKKKKVLIVTLACTVAVLAVTVAVFVFLLLSPENQLKECVGDRDWASASRLYEKSFRGNEKKEEKADEILRSAVDELKEEFIAGTMDYSTVKRHLKGIEKFWDDSYVEEVLEQVRELGDSREAFKDAQEYMQKEEYEDAIRLYGEVIESDANYETAKEKLETAKNRYKEKLLAEAEAYVEVKDYDSAIALVENGLEILTGDTMLDSRLEELQGEREEYGIEAILEEAKKLASQNNYFEAMEAARQGLEEKPGNDKLETALNNYSEKYKQDILAKAENAVGTDENYEAGILVFDSALNTLDGDYAKIEQTIREKREEYVQRQLEKSQRENEQSAIVGVWQGIMVSSDGLEAPMDQFLAWSGMQGMNTVIDCQPSGSFHLDILGETADGAWRRDEAGNGVYYLDVGGDVKQVRIDPSGRLHMNLNGIELTFEKTREA